MRKKPIYYRDWAQMPLVLTPEEVALILSLNVQTVRKYARDQTIPSIKVGKSHRFDRKVIQELVENGRGQ